MESFRPEFREIPCPLITVVGSCELQDKVVSYLCTINEEYVPKLRFTLVPSEYRFPTKKQVREKYGTFPTQIQRDFEGYQITGILKTQWMKKHQSVIPAVILVFHEYNPMWELEQWHEKEKKLLQQVQKLQWMVSARECHVLIILLQQVPTTTNMTLKMHVTDDRVPSLRKKLETDEETKTIVVHLVTSMDLVRENSSVLMKVEAEIRRMAREYYKAQLKRVKRYMKTLAKAPGYEVWHARLNFKMAHYNEFRRYTTKILQYYEASYGALISLPLHENEAVNGIAYTQVLTMAEIVNFKLCYHLIFSAHNVKGAVDQLQRHMDVYGRTMIAVDRAYEHWDWVSRQYHVFAQLLLKATSIQGLLPDTGLDSNVYKEPYLYFSIAAKYAMFRRKAAMKLGLTTATTVSTVTASGETIPERDFVVVPSIYVGGDPVVSEASATLQGPSVAALVKYRHAVERAVPHAKRSILLLEHAIHHLTVYVADQNAPRSRLKCRLLVHLGTERLALGECDRACAELENAKATFSIENCWAQTAQILKQLLRCTFRQGHTAAYLDYSLQLLSPVVEKFVLLKERGRIQDYFLTAWRNPAALGSQFTENSALTNGYELALDRSRQVFALTARFDRAFACVKEDVTLELKLQSHFPSLLVMSQIELVFNDERYRTVIYHRDEDTSGSLTYDNGIFFTSLEFSHKSIKEVRVPLRVLDGRQVLSIQEVRFYLGGESGGGKMESVDVDDKRPLEKCLVLSLLVERTSVEQREMPQPYLINGRVPAMGNGSASPSFSRRKSMFSLVEGSRSANADVSESIQEDGTFHLRGSSLIILQPRAKATLSMLSHEPLLTGDFRELAFQLAANEDSLEDVTFRIVCEPPPTSFASSDAFFFTEQSGVLTPVLLNANLQPQDVMSLPDKSPQTEETFHIIVRSPRATPVTLIVSVAYTTKTGVTVRFNERFNLVCHDPFAIQGSFIHDFLSGGGVPGAAQMAKGSYGCVGSLVNYQGSITCTSGEALRVLALEFEPRETKMVEDLVTWGFESSLMDLNCSNNEDVCTTLNDGDTRCFCLRLVPKVASPFVTLGRVKIIWRRMSSSLGRVSTSSCHEIVNTWLELPLVSFVSAPLTFSVKTPPFGVEGIVGYMDIWIKNNEAVSHSFRIKPVDTDGTYLISGRMNATEDLFPFDEQVFRLGLVPMKTGYLRLPCLEIMSLTYNLPLTNLDERQELFVLPREYPDWFSEPTQY